MKRANQWKIFISFSLLLFSIAWHVRVLPIRPWHPLGGNFFINGFYGIVYTIENGQMYETFGLGIESQFSRGVYTSSADLGRTLANALIITVFTDTATPEGIAGMLRNVPWVGMITFPAAMIASIEMVPGRRTFWERGITLTASLFGTYKVIYLTNHGGENAVFAWSMILFALYAITKMQKSNYERRYKAILLISSGAVLIYYHTASVILLILMAIYFSGKFALDRRRGLGTFFLIYSTAFLWYFMNASTTYFTSYIVKLTGLVETLVSLSPEVGSTPTAISYAYESPIELPTYYRVISVGSRAAIALLFVVLSILFVRDIYKRKRLQPYQEQLLIYMVAVPVIGLFIFQAHGLGSGISRTFEYGFIVFGLLVVTVNRADLPNILTRRRLQLFVTVVLVSGAIMGSFIYAESPSRGTGLIEDSEYESAQFAAEHQEGGIWTDYRISGAVIAQSNYEIYGIWPADHQTTKEQFERIYYSDNPNIALDEINQMSDGRVEYLLLSENMMVSRYGINANGIRFENMTREEYGKFGETDRANHVYDSGDGEVYEIAEEDGGN
jgi:hypothetical protein